ncbi:hypothetical protein ABIE26_003956 [Pedobacter africanus]|uniref:Uncharacterized protein n=1 Tax=Pedobacter africanus TaxID=151894 RepID=A0ACC6L1L4_9SPHI|nr:protein-disulfide reductase DsbD domain-containing protein [Pedobacter africanus]MDR6785257.1 hypothetical protein [Pedobacter africanus]
MKRVIFILLLTLLGIKVTAQIYSPVTWSYAAKKATVTEATIYLKAVLPDGWHIYSVNQKPGGPLKTSFTFEPSADYELLGRVTEPMPLSKYEPAFGIQVDFFKKEVVFQQKIKLKKPETVVKGKIEFMACTDKQCTPPLEKEFSIPVK